MKRVPITLLVATFLAGSVYTLAHHEYIKVQTQPAAVSTIRTMDDAPAIKTTVIDPAEAEPLLSTVNTTK